jgi:nitrite reductase/ring-hydroxylating ferredoxin subunit
MKTPGVPRWKTDFPVLWEEDQFVTRRELGRFLAVTSLGLALGTVWTALRTRFRRPVERPRSAPLAGIDEIPVGGYKLFRYPSPEDPAILVRLGESQFAAYSQRCTHLNCPVYFQGAERRFRCPCHEGSFAAEDGRVVGGPPPRPLPRIALTLRDGKVWAGGTEPS